MATFGALTFRLLVSAPGYEQEALVSDTPVPGGSSSFVDLGGTRLAHFRGSVVLDTFADFQALLALLGSAGQTLAYSEASLGAVLLSCHRTRILPNGKQFADVEFLLT